MKTFKSLLWVIMMLFMGCGGGGSKSSNIDASEIGIIANNTSTSTPSGSESDSFVPSTQTNTSSPIEETNTSTSTPSGSESDSFVPSTQTNTSFPIEETNNSTNTPSTPIVETATSTPIVDTTANYYAAKNNILSDLKENFEGFTVVVDSNVLVTSTSTGTIALYGNINGKSTNALFKLNTNYNNGDVFIVKVYDGETLVGESDKVLFTGGILEFSDITTH
jgi:hypothetical protein